MKSLHDTTHAITVRLPERLLRRTKRMAAARRLSVNALVRVALERLDAEERQCALSACYADLGADVEEADVEPFVEAQAEVAGRG